MTPTPPNDPTVVGMRQTPLDRFPSQRDRGTSDFVVVEEPLEVRIGEDAIATVMRTPGHDQDLVLGFLFGEGIVQSSDEIGALAFCSREVEKDDPAAGRNIATLHPRVGLELLDRVARRYSPAVSSCGVCGKRSIEEALAFHPPPTTPKSAGSPPAGRWICPEVLAAFPDALRQGQDLFTPTGALHAAAIFDDGERPWITREDIGRHNAVDKVVGAAFHQGRLPLSRSILQVSGRASFEIVQKAYRAGIPVVSAVSGVSSLAIDMAKKVGMSLAGFVRDGRFSLYVDGGHIDL